MRLTRITKTVLVFVLLAAFCAPAFADPCGRHYTSVSAEFKFMHSDDVLYDFYSVMKAKRIYALRDACKHYTPMCSEREVYYFLEKEYKTANARSALTHGAAKEDFPEAFKFLTTEQEKMNPNYPNEYMETPMMIAAKYGSTLVLTYMRDSKVKYKFNVRSTNPAHMGLDVYGYAELAPAEKREQVKTLLNQIKKNSVTSYNDAERHDQMIFDLQKGLLYPEVNRAADKVPFIKGFMQDK